MIQERRSALSKATIRAPVDGVVGQRDVEIGMVVGPSSILFLVGDLEELVVEVPLTQEMLGELTGLTPVHTNRVLRKLRADKILVTGRQRVDILDLSRLEELAEFRPPVMT